MSLESRIRIGDRVTNVLKVKMYPGKEAFGSPDGISRVIEKYYQHGYEAGIDFVEDEKEADLTLAHAGLRGPNCDVSILHGLYFTGDYPAIGWEYKVNRDIVQSVRSAKAITVPSMWVSEVFQRDMHINPFVVPHGIDIEEWDHTLEKKDYILYNKNRDGDDVCNCTPVDELAKRFTDQRFVSTFSRSNPENVTVTGVMKHSDMRNVIQHAGIYLSVTKETFGIGILEAMASGVPVLGWRYGGNVDLVRHGINGYLAEPGNYDDLARGLVYILNNRKVLASNSRVVASDWTWYNAVLALRKALEFAYEKKHEPKTISVIIPVYNYAHKVERAVKSVVDQKLHPDEVVLVNDGSTDNTKDELVRIQNSYPDLNIKVLNKPNGGVATARNAGAKMSTSKYLCFLDADDEMAPEFLDVCSSALDNNPELYIAYTRLKFINDQTGANGVSGWPDHYDFDKQLKRQNQVPTCCVMRREVFERTGGYRQRFAPNGAGAEDADLWTRAGALGMGGELIDERPLFIYHMGEGNTSGNKDYREPDWLSWTGYLKTQQHPFASFASPRFISHPVYQYDEPVVSVIIPVGPGHEKDILDALDSIEAQTFKKWEAIVVSDTDNPIDLSPWPFVRYFHTPNPRSGPGVARNIGVNQARGKFVVFLDADDYLTVDALEQMLINYSNSQSIVYSHYYGIATIMPENIDQFKDRLIDYNPKRNRALLLHKALEYNCTKAQEQPNQELYHWSIVTCLIPKAWHKAIGGFDELMKSWEDVDYHWRMARAGYCYSLIEQPLVYYHFDTGHRRDLANPETNGQTARELLQYMERKYKDVPAMSCKNCGGQKPALPSAQILGEQKVNSTTSNSVDENFILVIYNHPNRGEHPVIGPKTMTRYGYHSGGDRMLIHKDDQALMPDLFVRVDTAVRIAGVPTEEQAAPPAPIALKEKQTYETSSGKFDIESVPGITPVMAKHLVEAGYGTKEKFLTITQEVLDTIDGIGKARAKAVLAVIEKMKEDEPK